MIGHIYQGDGEPFVFGGLEQSEGEEAFFQALLEERIGTLFQGWIELLCPSRNDAKKNECQKGEKS